MCYPYEGATVIKMRVSVNDMDQRVAVHTSYVSEDAKQTTLIKESAEQSVDGLQREVLPIVGVHAPWTGGKGHKMHCDRTLDDAQKKGTERNEEGETEKTEDDVEAMNKRPQTGLKELWRSFEAGGFET